MIKNKVMKADELMIGDWVEPDQCMIPIVYCKILGIYPDGTVNIDKAERLFTLDELHPIPLAPEILEKNGFKKNKTGQLVIEKKHSIGCCGQTCDNTNPLEYAVWWDEFGLGCVSYLYKEGDVTLCGTTYVHQLQQILRFFDLDKFIKIEL